MRCEDGPMARPSTVSPAVRERFVRLVQEHTTEHGSQWGAIASIATTAACTTEMLRRGVRQAERDAGQRAGPPPMSAPASKPSAREELLIVRVYHQARRPITASDQARGRADGRSWGPLRQFAWPWRASAKRRQAISSPLFRTIGGSASRFQPASLRRAPPSASSPERR